MPHRRVVKCDMSRTKRPLFRPCGAPKTRTRKGPICGRSQDEFSRRIWEEDFDKLKTEVGEKLYGRAATARASRARSMIASVLLVLLILWISYVLF